MREFTLGDLRLRCRRLSALDQWHLLRAVLPVHEVMRSIDGAGSAAEVGAATGLPSVAPLARLPDGVLAAAFSASRRACQELVAENWVDLQSSVKLDHLVKIVGVVSSENFGALFALKRPSFFKTLSSGADYEPVALSDGEDWLWRPVLARLCPPDAIWSGEYRIEHFARMNDALDVREENERRARRAAEKK